MFVIDRLNESLSLLTLSPSVATSLFLPTNNPSIRQLSYEASGSIAAAVPLHMYDMPLRAAVDIEDPHEALCAARSDCPHYDVSFMNI